MADSFFGDVSETVSNITSGIGETITGIGTGISNLLMGNVGTDPNRLISAFRSQGIPSGAERNYSGTSVDAKFSAAVKNKDWRVKISHPLIFTTAPVMDPLVGTGGMIFPYLPTINIAASANYETIHPTHTNYPIMAYKNSQIDDITITGDFTVQSQDEARYWLGAIHFLRTVTKMYFGQGDNLGNPPPICTLNGYGDFVFNNVSCVVKSFNVSLDKDVDYIAVQLGSNTATVKGTKSGTNISYVPTKSTVSVVLSTVYSRTKMKNFNLTRFANGELITAPDKKGFI